MKIQNALVSIILDRSQRYVAHVTTVTLSWRVQNILVIGRVYFTLECFEFSSNFEFDRNMLSGTGARSVNWVMVGLANALSPVWHQAINWTMLLYRYRYKPLGTNLSEIWLKIWKLCFKKNIQEWLQIWLKYMIRLFQENAFENVCKIWLKIIFFSRKWIWKCHLQFIHHSVQASMS